MYPTPGGSDTRYPIASFTDFNNQWFKPYVKQENNIRSLSAHASASSWIQDHSRPHLNVIIDKKHKVKALVDSGSSICLADASLLDHIISKSPNGPKIHVTDCHNNQKLIRGCYQAILDIEENMPYPIRNRMINIHIAEKLSSELILGTDFLKENGAIINVRNNSVAFLPNHMEAIGICQKPIITEAVASLADTETPYENLTANNNSAYMLQSTEDQTLGHILFSSMLYSPSGTYGAGAMLDVIITVVPGFRISVGLVITWALKVIWSMCPNVRSSVDCSMYALLLFAVKFS